MDDSLRQQSEALGYDDHILPLTDPALLLALGRLAGLPTADVQRCRVLELGCGRGLNLLAMARRLPGAQFVGVDLVEAGLAQGRQVAAEAGLSNVQLIQADLRDFRWNGAPFDLVLAWGVFSWVPDDVKTALLRCMRACLAPAGVASLCYLTLPGSARHQALRDLMLLRADDELPPPARVEVARSTLRALVHAGSAVVAAGARADPWQSAARAILDKPAAQLFHDELGAVYDPCYLLQFVDWAQEEGLVYVADADTPGHLAERLPAAAAQALRDWSTHPLEREQAADFLGNRTLRVPILARDADAAALAWRPDALRGLCIGSLLQPDGVSGTRFIDTAGARVDILDAACAAVVDVASSAPGQRQPLPTLWAQAVRARGWPPDAALPEGLCARLWSLAARGHLSVSLLPRGPAPALAARPRLHALNRALLQHRRLLACDTQQVWRLDAADAALVALLDGEHSLEAILQSAAAAALGAMRVDRLLALLNAEGCLEPEDGRRG